MVKLDFVLWGFVCQFLGCLDTYCRPLGHSYFTAPLVRILEFHGPSKCKEETCLLKSFRPTGTSGHCSPPRRTTGVGAMVPVTRKKILAIGRMSIQRPIYPSYSNGRLWQLTKLKCEPPTCRLIILLVSRKITSPQGRFVQGSRTAVTRDHSISHSGWYIRRAFRQARRGGQIC